MYLSVSCPLHISNDQEIMTPETLLISDCLGLEELSQNQYSQILLN
jgi:hypothetical protein